MAPGESIELIVEDTEPGNQIRLLNHMLHVTLLHQDERHGVDYEYALLAANQSKRFKKSVGLLRQRK